MTISKKGLRRIGLEAAGLLDHPPRIALPGPNAAPDIEEPLPDAMYQDPHYTRTLEVVRTHFSLYPRTLVYGNSPIYYEDDQGRTRWVLPDCYVAFDVDAEAIQERNGYFMREVGRAPDFALEIASVSTYRNDLGPKRELYARLGIDEYWRFDGTGGRHYGEPLVGETLVDGEYRRLGIHRESDNLVWGHSPVLGLDLCWIPDRLRFFNPETREYLLYHAELEAARQAAEARANAAESRANTAEAELAALREQLRRLQG